MNRQTNGRLTDKQTDRLMGHLDGGIPRHNFTIRTSDLAPLHVVLYPCAIGVVSQFIMWTTGVGNAF